MIVVEGPDGAGKSTLCQYLSESLELPIAPKVVSSQGAVLTDLKKWVEKNVAGGFQATIFDRHRLISGPIYGALLGRTDPAFYDHWWMHLHTKQFYQANPIIIYCLPPFDVIKGNIEHGEADNEMVKGIVTPLYDLYMARASLDTAFGRGLIFDYTQIAMDSIAECVYTHLKENS